MKRIFEKRLKFREINEKSNEINGILHKINEIPLNQWKSISIKLMDIPLIEWIFYFCPSQQEQEQQQQHKTRF